jgi:uncharacterized protein YkwD
MRTDRDATGAFPFHGMKRSAAVALMLTVAVCVVPILQSRNEDPKTELLRFVNQERNRKDLKLLAVSDLLSSVAQAHAEDLAAHNLRGHKGSDGLTLELRVQRAGYSYSFVAENIAYLKNTPPEILRLWMNSRPHRAAILRPEYHEAGFGYAYSDSSEYKHYWVMVLGCPR